MLDSEAHSATHLRPNCIPGEGTAPNRAGAPAESCIHTLFEAQVLQRPDAIALVFEDQQLTYLELNRRANRLANHLRRLGVTAETLVGILLNRSLETVIAILGVLKAGGAYIPLV